MVTKLRVSFLLLWLVLSIVPAMTPAQEPLDGPNRIFKDELLNNLEGDWRLTRDLHGQHSKSSVHAEWVLNHQFLFIHMKELSVPTQYEARIYVGYDNTSERYVAHWIDIFGGRFSEALGYGTRDGNSIKFKFEYPDGPFHNTFTWHPDTKTWTTLLEQKDVKGKWANFAKEEFVRS